MAIKAALQCKDKHGRELRIGDEIIVRGKIVGLPMELEDDGRAIAKVTWHGGIPLSNLVESRELESAISFTVTAKPATKPKRRQRKEGGAVQKSGEPDWGIGGGHK